jgi:primosomal protein N' (replication factor Y)
LKHWGLGTERVEQAVRAEFPSARVARMDSDTMTQRSAYIETLGAFRARKTDILIGTQMIAKGLDFPNVTLVGVVLADTALHMPDFRGRERTFQLVSQVSGRAGRSEKGGRVIVQTHLPNDPAIAAAASHDAEKFVLEELRERRAFNYPPFSRLARIVLRAKESGALNRGARTLAEALLKSVADNLALKSVQILGPTDAPVAKIEDYFRKHILIKAPTSDELSLLLNGPIADMLMKLPGVEGVIDVDAVSMM